MLGAEGAAFIGELERAAQAVAALDRQIGSSASAAGGAPSQGDAELVTLAVKAAVALRKAVPDATGLGIGGEEAAVVVAALEAAGSLLAAATHLKSCAGALLPRYTLVFIKI